MSLVARRTRIDGFDGFDEPSFERSAARQGVLHIGPTLTLLGTGALRAVDLGALEATDAPKQARKALNAIKLSGDDGARGSLPRCHVAYPFDRAQEAIGWLAPIQLTLSPEGCWITVIGADESELEHLFDLAATMGESVPVRARTPVMFDTFHEDPPAAHFGKMVQDALADILGGTLDKVVLSRSVIATTSSSLDPAEVVARMRDREPSCTLYSLPAGQGRFIGASPELLVARDGVRVTSHPLAGTVSLNDELVDRSTLASSEKDLEEHRLVVDDLSARLAPHLSSISVPEHPSLVSLRSVAHLGSRMEGVIRADDPAASVVSLLQAVHPTPAIGGVPRQGALATIAHLEGARRELFGGAVGWFDAAGDGEWMLAIRGATLEGNQVSIRAGAGIVRGSTPLGEEEETRIKLASILNALVDEGSSQLEPILRRASAS